MKKKIKKKPIKLYDLDYKKKLKYWVKNAGRS